MPRMRPDEPENNGHQRLETLAANTSTVFWFSDPDGSAVELNPSWAAFTGQDFAAYSLPLVRRGRHLVVRVDVELGDEGGGRARGGLGIGLSLVRTLVGLHGGQVTVASRGLGHGTTFSVRLPWRAEVPAVAGASSESGEHASSPSLRVAVVEDNDDGRATLLDLGLPVLDGLEVCRRLRADPALRSARLVALTGRGTEHDREQTEQAGFDEHLTRPVEPQTLRSTLARVAGR